MQEIIGLPGFPDPISTHPKNVAVRSLVDNLLRMNMSFHLRFKGVAFLVHVCMSSGCETHAYGTGNRENDTELDHVEECVDIVRRSRPYRFAFVGPVLAPPDKHVIEDLSPGGTREWFMAKSAEWALISEDLRETEEHPDINNLREISAFGADVKGASWVITRHAKQIPFDDEDREYKVDHSLIREPCSWSELEDSCRSESCVVAMRMRDLLVKT